MNQPREYTTIVESIDALQWTGENATAVQQFCGQSLIGIHDRGFISISAGRGAVRGEPGHWIVRKHGSDVFALLPDAVFQQLYAEVEERQAPAPVEETPVDPTLADA